MGALRGRGGAGVQGEHDRCACAGSQFAAGGCRKNPVDVGGGRPAQGFRAGVGDDVGARGGRERPARLSGSEPAGCGRHREIVEGHLVHSARIGAHRRRRRGRIGPAQGVDARGDFIGLKRPRDFAGNLAPRRAVVQEAEQMGVGARGHLPAESDLDGTGHDGFQPGLLAGRDGAASGGIGAVERVRGLVAPRGVAAGGPGEVAAIHGVAQRPGDGQGYRTRVDEAGQVVREDDRVGEIPDRQIVGVGVEADRHGNAFPAGQRPARGHDGHPVSRGRRREGNASRAFVRDDVGRFGRTERTADDAVGHQTCFRPDGERIADRQGGAARFQQVRGFVAEMDVADVDARRQRRRVSIQEHVHFLRGERLQDEAFRINGQPRRVGFHAPGRGGRIGFGEGVGLVFRIEGAAFLAGGNEPGPRQHRTVVRHLDIHEDRQMVGGGGAGAARERRAPLGQAAAEIPVGIIDLALRRTQGALHQGRTEKDVIQLAG